MAHGTAAPHCKGSHDSGSGLGCYLSMAWPQVCSSVQLHLVVSSQDVLCCFSFVDVLMVRVIVGEEK